MTGNSEHTAPNDRMIIKIINWERYKRKRFQPTSAAIIELASIRIMVVQVDICTAT
jgi:hypothetical protein